LLVQRRRHDLEIRNIRKLRTSLCCFAKSLSLYL
jgi:hypothetical protein